ncbi:hypothetical protein EV385_1077 [Krasilnikovia cinnamomea]|uniref:DUF2637 domain-containing protein n=1 Tax=Krasilnikovia cinnamomea TaxID=349313 RepID=A0A4Q7ZF02_9ACTN|nr:hypothetical protein EV385_1077 [Krasilnikovia cinnamomea]
MTTTAQVSSPDTRTPRRRLSVDTAQVLVLVVIVLFVGLMAGAASFHHVKEWTLDNSPTGTAAWFGWANAVISELIPTASIIEIGRRRRRNPAASVRYPMVLLVGSVGFSLTAQLAVAKPGPSGWVVSALPALAFLGLSKLVFTATATPRPTNPVTAPMPATSRAPSLDTTRAKVRPAAATPKTRATTTAKKSPPATKTAPRKRTPAKKTSTAAPDTTASAPATATASAPAARQFPEPLLSNARTIARAHRDERGEDINPNQLAVRLRVPTTTATDILTHLHTNPPTPATTRPHNGTTLGVNA